jgi:hypothetical protein
MITNNWLMNRSNTRTPEHPSRYRENPMLSNVHTQEKQQYHMQGEEQNDNKQQAYEQKQHTNTQAATVENSIRGIGIRLFWLSG